MDKLVTLADDTSKAKGQLRLESVNSILRVSWLEFGINAKEVGKLQAPIKGCSPGQTD